MAEPAPHKPYPDVDPQPHFPEVERQTLAFWAREGIFRESVERRPAGAKGENEYVFYDGPPFANGLPHYGHLLTGYVKDIVPRYQTMRGRRVERRFGWDCHGLPAEMQAEKELGLSGRAAILEHGIDRFNAHCRTSVLRYTKEWEEYVTRQARWVDFEHDYKTMDLSYMESVLWAFGRLWDQGLVYEGCRVLPYSWACQTPLSNFETRLDNAFRDRQDPAITVRFELEREVGEESTIELWAWTTTPWTLPSNLALAVGPDIDYAFFESDHHRIVIAEAAAERFETELAGARRTGSRPGRELVGRRYKPLFPFFCGTENAFQVLAGDFVSTEEGTGVVHLAPGFGEDDMEVCNRAAIPVVCPVDEAGRFTEPVSPWAGLQVFEANKGITRDLRERDALVKHETIVHGYPHCWRTDTPLIYRAFDSWYVKVTTFRERMVELNREIRWIPEHIRDGLFGNWLENARDWSISRNRFWGAPIPVWKSDDPNHPRLDVYGSLDALERDFGVRLEDLHRPAVDALTRPNPDDPSGRSTMRRVPEVLDCWFESGSMPFAQVHYPFDNREWFESHFPADFIVEYTAQTRGWFYTMVVLSTALFDRHPFRTCICHGTVLDQDGRKLSKRFRNYPDPLEVFETHGADALRWYLMASPILRGNELRIDREGKGIGDVVRNVLNPLWNAYSFFCLYANVDGVRARERADARGLLDRYLLAKTRELAEQVTARMDDYDLGGACQRVLGYLDALTNWYIRRSRERFWRSGASPDKRDAYDTLFTALTTLCRVTAPLLPLVTEEVFRGLTDRRSVHLEDWPEATRLPAEPDLVAHMDRVRDACSSARNLRDAHGVRVRQPLRRLTVAGPGVLALEPYLELIRDEVNVKEVRLAESIEDWASFRLQANARVLGPRLGTAMKELLAAARAGDWTRDERGRVHVAGRELEPGEYELRLEPREGVACQPLSSHDAIVVLDLELDEELIQEGLARDLVRAVQQARKDAGLHVADRIRLAMALPSDWRRAAERFHDWIAEQTLAREVELVEEIGGPELSRHETQIGGERVRIGLARSPEEKRP